MLNRLDSPNDSSILSFVSETQAPSGVTEKKAHKAIVKSLVERVSWQTSGSDGPKTT